MENKKWPVCLVYPFFDNDEPSFSFQLRGLLSGGVKSTEIEVL
jgi:hypothetical protein